MQNYWNLYLACKQQQLYGPVNYRGFRETGPRKEHTLCWYTVFLSVLYLCDFSKNITGIGICLISVNRFKYSSSNSFYKHNGFLHLQLPALTRGRSCENSEKKLQKVVINMTSSFISQLCDSSYMITLIVGYLLYYLMRYGVNSKRKQ